MGPGARLSVLILCDPERVGVVDQLATDLRASGAFDVDVSTDAERLLDLDTATAVYADRARGPLSGAQAAAVTAFVRNGGTVVAAGGTLAAWAPAPGIAKLAGWSPDGRTVHTELVVHSPEGEQPSFTVRDTVHLLPEAPPESTQLLQASWRYGRQVLAYRRRAGAGHFTYVGLAHDAATYANPAFRRMVAGSLRDTTAGGAASRTLGVGLLGYGALGGAHAAAIAAVPGLELRAVCDRAEVRREAAAALDVPAVATAEELYRVPELDVVLVATPPTAHVDAVLQALDAGKHVVCEKPFALRTVDCDLMIERSAATERALTVFQNRRWDPDFVMLQRAVRSGAIGHLFYMESFVGGYAHPCEYWHSHEPISGGAVFDWGSHYIDWILQLFEGEVTAVRSMAHKRVWHDVTNADQVGVEMVFADGAQALFTHSEIAAAAKPKWYVLGTEGAVVGEWQTHTERVRGPDGEVDERPVMPTDLPARVRVLRPDGHGGAHEETLSLPPRDRTAFYRNLAGHLLRGEPLAVTAADARRTVTVMEAATASAQRGGALVELAV